ncbi:hypothetical protein ACHQM5_025303 [Ranunculus cassubicifolius]
MEDYVRKLALWHTKTFKPIMTHDELEPIMSTLGFVGSSPTTINGGGAWKQYAFNGVGVSDHHHRHCHSSMIENDETEVEDDDDDSSSSLTQSLFILPSPRLPYPRIDGLHIYTYRAFCDAVAFYIGNRDLPDHFHVRGMPLHIMHDRPFNKKFRPMNEEDMLYVFRDGTLDPATLKLYNNTTTTTTTATTTFNNTSTTTTTTTTTTTSGSINKSDKTRPYIYRRNRSIILHNKATNIGALVALKDVIVL